MSVQEESPLRLTPELAARPHRERPAQGAAALDKIETGLDACVSAS